MAAQFAATVSDPRASRRLALAVTLLHIVLWTAILTVFKHRQDIHFDIAEAFDWGQTFQLGYVKHPPLSGWFAGLWFRLFPATDWSAYGLAMTTCGIGMLLGYATALRVVDRRRAFVVLVMLALYPIFNFKGFKFNADLMQLVTLPLLVLAYLDAFAKRTVWSGVALGLAVALALLTKYWVVTMVGAIGLAALLHPQRAAFWRSPAPWVAVGTMLLGLAPHLIWLAQSHFAPLRYAGDTYSISDRGLVANLVLGYVGHNAALLALPVALAALALVWRPRRLRALLTQPLLALRGWSRAPNPSVDPAQALNVWLIQAIVAIGPPLGALTFSIYLKTDWGISLFFLMPLALIAIPQLRVQKGAPLRLAAIWFLLSLATFGGASRIADRTERAAGNDADAYKAHSDLARQLTQVWQARFLGRWRIIVAPFDLGEGTAFYIPNHPTVLATDERLETKHLTRADAARDGFIGVCDANAWNAASCEAYITANFADTERLTITSRRVVQGRDGNRLGRANVWKVFVGRPAALAAPETPAPPSAPASR